jgi:hypothetical protein
MASRKAKKPWLRLTGNVRRERLIEAMGLAQKIDLPNDEKVVVKEVPAKVDGTVVGTAQIYEDGTVGVIIDDDAPQWAKDKIKFEADQLGYSIGTDENGGIYGSS